MKDMRISTPLFLVVVSLCLVQLVTADAAAECRQTNELEIARVNRLQLGKLYHENLALNTNTTGTTAGTGKGVTPYKLVDGDRCCSNADNTTDGEKCGVSFALDNNNYIYAQVTINQTAFVNEFITAWYLPCRNEPRPFYVLQYYDYVTHAWTDMYTRVLKANSIVKEEPKPCYVIPGDKGDVSLCIDFLDYPARPSDQFRIRFNNSEASTGLPADFTDGGWIYEMEVHGVYANKPWELQNDGLSISTFQSALNVSLGQINLYTANINQERLHSQDVATTNVVAKLVTYPAGANADHLLIGSKNLTVVNGNANFTDLKVERPPAGTYNLTFNAPGVPVPTSVLFTIIPGLPYELKVISGDASSQKSAINGAIASVTVSVRDPGNNVVTNHTSYQDPHMTVSITNSVTGSFGGTKYVSISNTTGSAIFSDLTLNRPTKGSYTLYFNTPGVSINTTSTFTITEGNPETLVVVAGSVTGPHPSIASTLMNTVQIEARDPGNNLTPLASGTAVTVTMPSNASFTLTGTTSETVQANGTVFFSNIRVLRPVVGDYKLDFALAGVGTAVVSTIAKVSIGPATELRIGNAPGHTYVSDYVVNLNAINVRAHDAGGNLVGAQDTLTRPVAVSIANASQALNGSLSVNMTNGDVTFNALSLLAPPIGTYTLVFSTTGLLSTTQNLVVNVGPARILAPTITYIARSSIETVSLGSITVQVLDAGRTPTGTSDSANNGRTVTAAFVPSRQIGGTLTPTTTNGVVTFSDLSMNAPVAQNYTLTFSAAGLVTGSLVVAVTPGPARSLQIKPGTTYVYPSNVTTRIADVIVRAHDASNTFVGTYQMAQSGSLNATVKINTAGSALGGVLGAKDLTNGEVTFGGLTLASPPVGTYVLEFYMNSLVSALLNVNITVGAAYRLRVVDPASITRDSVVNAGITGVVVHALDAGNTFVGTSDVITRTVTITCGTATLAGTTSANMVNGSAVFNGTVLSSPSAITHVLTYSSAGLLSDSLNVQITTGPLHSLRVINTGATSYPSMYDTVLANMRVETLDAGGNFTTRDQTESVTVKLYNGVGADVTATYLRNANAQAFANNGFVVFTGIALASPPQGTYTLQFDCPTAAATNATVTVVVGPAVKLGTANTVHSYQSLMRSNVSTIRMQVRDAGDNPLLGGDPLNNRTITVDIRNASQALVGTLSKAVTNGEVDFTDLGLPMPRTGVYVLRFSATGLVFADVSVTITIGPVVKLVVNSPASISKPTAATVAIDSMTVRGQDAGSNDVLATDTVTRPVTVTVSAPGMFTGGSGTSGNMVNGQVVFSNLALVAPHVITYTLTFATANLTSAVFPVVIQTGAPVYLDLQSNGNAAVLQSADPLTLAPIVVRTLDAGRNFTALDATGSKVVAVEANSTDAKLQFESDLLTSGTAGVVNFAGAKAIRLNKPLVGNYLLTFFTLDAQLANVTFAFRVNPGTPYALAVHNWMPTTYASDYKTPLQTVTLRVQDVSTNFLGTFDSASRTVSVQGPSFLNGTLSRTSSNGEVQFADLAFLSSTVGVHALNFSSPGLRWVVQNVMTKVGPARKVTIKMPAGPITVDSQAATPIPTITVTIRDAGNTEVLDTDAGNDRPVSVTIAGQTLNGASCTTVNGTCTIANMVLVKPPTNPYTMVFASAGMENGLLGLNVNQGKAFSLDTDGYTLQVEPSVVDLVWSPITVITRNAGGNFTNDNTPLLIKATVDPAQGNTLYAPLMGDTEVTAVNGRAVFSNLRLASPARGVYQIRFSGYGMDVNATVVVQVSTGNVWNLKVSSFDTSEPIRSEYKSLVKPVTIQAINAGGDHVGALDTNTTRLVRVELLNTTLAGISGTLQGYLNESTVVFNNIILENATATTLTLRFWTSDIRPSGQPVYTDAKVAVVVGEVRGLVVHSGGNQQQSCETSFQLSPMQVRTVDAGRNFVSTEFSSTVSITLVNNVAAVSGNNTEIITNGVADFSQVVLSSPIDSPISSGAHVLRFSTYNSVTLQQLFVDTPITITKGTASRLKIQSVGGSINTVDTLGGNFATTLTYGGKDTQGRQRVLLPDVVVRAYDNCHALQDTVAMTVTLVDLDNGLVPAAGLGASWPRAVTPPTATMTNGEARFQNVYVTPKVGTYRLQITAPNQKPSTLTVTVLPGPTGGLTFVGDYAKTGFKVVTDNKNPVNPPPTVQITDDVGNPLNATLRIRCSLTPNPTNLENNERRAEGGRWTFSEMMVFGRHGSEYTMRCATVAFGQGNELETVDFTGMSVSRCTDPSELGSNSEPDDNLGGTECKCSPGYYQVPSDSGFSCQACLEGTYKEKVGNEPCRKCPQNMNTGGLKAQTLETACICKPGFFNNATNPTCEECTEGGLCQSGKPIAPKPGFFRFRSGSSVFFPCPNEDACIGGQNASCQVGYEGPLCSVCKEGYGKFGVTCTPCGAAETSWFLVVGAIILVCLMLSFLVKTASVERSKNATILKILLNYLQVISFVGDLSVRWPRLIVEMFQMMRLSLFSLNLHPVDCSMRPSYYDRFIVYMIFPVLAFVGPAVWFVIYWAYRRFIRPPLSEAWHNYRNRNSGSTYGQGEDDKPWLMTDERKRELLRSCKTQYGLTVLIATFLAHPIITKNSFQMFNCVDFDGFKYVAEDLSVSCDTEEHAFWTAMAILMASVYCTGVPMLAVYLLWRNRHQLHTKAVQDRYRFLYDGYKTTRFYWEAVIMIRKVLIVMVIVFYREKPLTQLYSSLWVIFAALIAHLFARPFATHLTSRLEMFSLITTVVTLMTGLLYYSNELETSEEEGVNGFLISLNVIMLFTFVALLVHGLLKASVQAREVLKKQDQIANMLAKVGIDEDESKPGSGKGGKGEKVEMSNLGADKPVAAAAVDDGEKKKKKKKKKKTDADETEMTTLDLASPASVDEETTTKKKKKKKKVDVEEEAPPAYEEDEKPQDEPPAFDAPTTTFAPPPLEDTGDDELKKKKKKKKKKRLDAAVEEEEEEEE